MSFNKGFKCEKCGPIPTAKTKSVKKIKRIVCPDCERMAIPWIRPINERAGRCTKCGGAAFTLKVKERQLLRCCKNCRTTKNTDTGEILQMGEGQNDE